MPNEKGNKGRETRLRLLRAAEEEFALHGYHGAKISGIVRKADLTQPAFYLYFASKEAIYEELVQQFRTGMIELLERSRMEPGLLRREISVKVIHVMESVFSYLSSHRNLTLIGFIQWAEAETIKQAMTELIAANLLSEQKDGYFKREMNMELVAQSLVGVIDRLTVTQLLTGQMTPLEMATQIVDLFLHGILVDE